MDKTQMWYVGLAHVSPINDHIIVEVSDKPERLSVPYGLKVRSITPTAAARRFIRNNLPLLLANYKYEANVIEYSKELKKEIDKFCKLDAAKAQIKVIKSEDAHLPRRKQRQGKRGRGK